MIRNLYNDIWEQIKDVIATKKLENPTVIIHLKSGETINIVWKSVCRFDMMPFIRCSDYNETIHFIALDSIVSISVNPF